jgi:hypothetical protein
MSKMMGIYAGALVLAATPFAHAQSPQAKAPGDEKALGPRVRVEFRETRQEGAASSTTRSCSLLLHADGAPAWVFVGAQAPITTNAGGTATTSLKNVGLSVHVGVETRPDGRYGLRASFEESSPLAVVAEASRPGRNPIINALRGESQLVLRAGETAPFASAVDPVTGEVVRVDVTVEPADAPAAAASISADARLQARLVLVRRQGDTVVARRPYSVVLQADAPEKASVFGGSMLPFQVKANDTVTVMLKDIGAGLRLNARRVSDGRLRADFSFSDGALAPGEAAPRLRVFESESQLLVGTGEAVTVASAVDPETGETVEAELTLEALE